MQQSVKPLLFIAYSTFFTTRQVINPNSYHIQNTLHNETETHAVLDDFLRDTIKNNQVGIPSWKQEGILNSSQKGTGSWLGEYRATHANARDPQPQKFPVRTGENVERIGHRERGHDWFTSKLTEQNGKHTGMHARFGRSFYSPATGDDTLFQSSQHARK